ncbi:MAG: hypothetical protein M3O15_10510, partial [Acidobacteriota bacterium]|nr:hypothetical protein [Acidobacteriota bacterium]
MSPFETGMFRLSRIAPASTGQERARVEVEIPPASPLFDGHFPGRAILPAVAQLSLIAQALSALADEEMTLTEVRILRLRQTLGPGDRLEMLAIPAVDEGMQNVELLRGGETVSQGT